MDALVQVVAGLFMALIWGTVEAISSLIHWLLYGIHLAVSPEYRAEQRAHYEYTPFVKPYLILSAVGTIVLLLAVGAGWYWVSRDTPEPTGIVFEHRATNGSRVSIEINGESISGVIEKVRDKFSKESEGAPPD